MKSSSGKPEKKKSNNNTAYNILHELKKIENYTLSEENDETSLAATKSSLNGFLNSAFDGYMEKLKSIKKWNDEPNNEENLEYLVEMFNELKVSIVKQLMNLIDDRLVADRTAFISSKKKVIQQLYVSRDSIELHRRALQSKIEDRLVESESFMKKEYKLELLKENQTLNEELNALQSTYETLWKVQQDSTEQLLESEETIFLLNDTIQKSLESAATLRGDLIMLKEAHSEQIERLQGQYNIQQRKLSKLYKNRNSIVTMSSLSSINQSVDNSRSNSIMIKEDQDIDPFEMNIDLTCKDCELYKNQIKEIENALHSLRQSLQISKNRKNRTLDLHLVEKSQKDKVQRKAAKGSKISRAARAARDLARGSNIMSLSLTGDNDTEDDRSTLLDENFATDASLKTYKKKKSKHKSRHNSFSSKGRKKKGSSTIKSFADSASESSDMSRNSSRDFSRSPRRSSSEILMNNITPSSPHTPTLSSLMQINNDNNNNNEDFQNVYGLTLNDPNKSDSNSQNRNILNIMDQFNIDSTKKEAVMKALGLINTIETMEISSQTDNDLETLLKTYFDATKEAAALYLESLKLLKINQTTVTKLQSENKLLSEQLRKTTEKINFTENLRLLQFKERDLLLVELTDQLTDLRRKLTREQHIRDHIKAHDAPINMLNRQTQLKRKELSLPFVKLDTQNFISTPYLTDTLLLQEYDDIKNTKNNNMQKSVSQPDLQLKKSLLFKPVNNINCGNSNSPRNIFDIPKEKMQQRPATSHHKRVNNNQLEHPSIFIRPLTSPAMNFSTSNNENLNNTNEINHEIKRNFELLKNCDIDSLTSPSPSSYYNKNENTTLKSLKMTTDSSHKEIVLSNNENNYNEMDRIINSIQFENQGEKIDDERLLELKSLRGQIQDLLRTKMSRKVKKDLSPAMGKSTHAIKKRPLLITSQIDYI